MHIHIIQIAVLVGSHSAKQFVSISLATQIHNRLYSVEFVSISDQSWAFVDEY